MSTQTETSVNNTWTSCTGVWSPSLKPSTDLNLDSNSKKNQDTKAVDDAPPVVWTPKSAGASPSSERKEFRPVNFESPTLSRKNKSATSTPASLKPADVSYRLGGVPFLYYPFLFNGSSFGIATELWAGQSGIEPQWGRDFPPVQTGPGAHPTSCKMGTGSFPGVKCGRGVLLTTHSPLVPRSLKSRAIPLPTLWATPGL